MGWGQRARVFLGPILGAAGALLVGVVAVLAMAWLALFMAFSPSLHFRIEVSICLTIALVAVLGYCIRLHRDGRRRAAGAVAVALLGGLVGSWFANDAAYRAKTVRRYERWADEMLSVQVSFDAPVFACDSARDWRGEGYSFAVFDLPPELEAKFRAPDREYLYRNPRIPRMWRRYGSVPWQATPLPASYAPHREHALPRETGCAWCEPSCRDFPRHYGEARRIAGNAGGYFAFIHRPTQRPRPSDIVLFLVDLDTRRIYFANDNQ